MFLALIISAILSPCLVSTVYCEQVGSGNLSKNNGSLNFADLVFSPFSSVSTTPKLHLLQVEYPHLLISPNNSISKYILLKNETEKRIPNNVFSHRSEPARMPKVRSNSKDYGESSHYRMKEARDSSRKGYYMSMLQKVLRPSKKGYSGLNNRASKYDKQLQPMSSQAMSAPGWGWGWGKGGGGGHGHGHGFSLLDVLLCGLSLLSLGGFLLNLLLNLMNLFGFGMVTSTSTYPVTVTSTQTATATGGGGGGGTGTIVLPTAGSAVSGSGFGFTGRTIDSMAGNGWGWEGDQAHLKVHIKLPQKGWGWSTTTTTTTTTPTGGLLPLPTLTGALPLPTLTGALPVPTLTGGLLPIGRTFTGGLGRKRRKREMFEPYVDPATALDIFAKAVLNSIRSATNGYECMENIHCENNKRARVIGQWLEYFMPVYSFSVSYFGQRMGAHDSLLDHIRAIVLGATETNCQVHFPRCEEVMSGPK